MRKPTHLREETWQFIQSSGLPMSIWTAEDTPPGQAAFKAGIIQRPDLLAQSVIELDDECEYLIDEEAAEQLKRGAAVITLPRLGDKKLKTAPLAQVIGAIRDGAVFDQLSRSS